MESKTTTAVSPKPAPYAGHAFLRHPPATAETRIRPKTDPGDRAISPKSRPRFFVTNLDIDVTEACNLACVYCFKSELYGQYMTLNTMKRTFEWLLMASGTADEVNCNFMGGEPTMRWQAIKSFVPWARRRAERERKRVTFSMTSNMTLWDEEMCQFVDQYGFGLLMSIDGCPEVQDEQRPARNGRPVSDTVAKWAQRMLKTRPRATARATVHPTNINMLAKSFAYLQGLGFREVTFAPSDYGAWGDGHFEALDEQLAICENMMFDAYASGKPLGITVLSYLVNKLVKFRESGREDKVVFQNQPCGAGKGYLMVDYIGDIWPCHRFDGGDTDAGANGSYRLGNIFVDGFHQELQDEFLQFDHATQHKDACTTCSVNPVCGGYCPAANIVDTGTLHQPHDNYCRWSQATYRSALRLYQRFASSPELMKQWLGDVSGVHDDGR